MRKVAAYAVPCSAMRKFPTEVYHGDSLPRYGAGFRRSLGRFVWLFLGPVFLRIDTAARRLRSGSRPLSISKGMPPSQMATGESYRVWWKYLTSGTDRRQTLPFLKKNPSWTPSLGISHISQLGKRDLSMFLMVRTDAMGGCRSCFF